VEQFVNTYTCGILVNFSAIFAMESQFILRGPDQVDSIPDISLGRYLYQTLVDYGNRVAMVSVTLLLWLIALRIDIFRYCVIMLC